MPYVETPVGRLFVMSVGQGAPVTFWPCLLGDGGLWHPQATTLSSQARCLVLDGPGHGRSDPAPSAFTLEQCADAWIETLDRLGVTQPAVFVGLSWGAMVALRVALRHPQRVRALALFGAIGTSPRAVDRMRFEAFAAMLRVVGVAEWLAPRLTASMTGRSPHSSELQAVSQMLGRCRHLDRQGLHRAASAVLVEPTDVVDQLWRVHVPALICVGQDDRITPVPCARRVARALRSSELRIVPRAGHLLPLHDPQLISSWLADFVTAATAGHRGD